MRLRFNGKQPTPLYYCRELQNLGDPLHFQALMLTPRRNTPDQPQLEGPVAPVHKYREANDIEKQPQLDGRKRATRRWAGNKGSRGKKENAKS
jgi:hypothetical protein